MSQNSSNPATDLRGAGNLTINAILGITNIVESLHRTIADASETTDQSLTTTVTGMVYQSVRTVTQLIGAGIDIPLAQLGTSLGETESLTHREAVLSALNGVLGDHLVARDNPLAISMQLRHDGKPLNEQQLSNLINQSNGKLAIMVHG
ncbi:MAG: hypothetical protein GY943_12325, partial [Chloroflexi bacterium]|nr:hypothetical protein [Chloroflexota bacterium]